MYYGGPSQRRYVYASSQRKSPQSVRASQYLLGYFDKANLR
jgi:hypothetical protein